MDTRETLALMAAELVAINRETGNAAALTLCDLIEDLDRIALGLIWGGRP